MLCHRFCFAWRCLIVQVTTYVIKYMFVKKTWNKTSAYSSKCYCCCLHACASAKTFILVWVYWEINEKERNLFMTRRYKQLKKRIRFYFEWTSKWMNKWNGECVNEERMNERTNEQKNEWMNECINELII